MVLVDLGEVEYTFFPAAVVRRRVKCGADAAFGIYPGGRVTPQFEREHAREIGLEREHLEIEHDLHVVFEGVRHTGRRRRQLSRLPAAVAFLEALDALLEFADVLRVLIDAHAVGRTHVASQSGHLGHDPIQNAPIGATAHGALFRSSAGSEELLEHGPGIANHG